VAVAPPVPQKPDEPSDSPFRGERLIVTFDGPLSGKCGVPMAHQVAHGGLHQPWP
jgi:hypothetical protein